MFGTATRPAATRALLLSQRQNKATGGVGRIVRVRTGRTRSLSRANRDSRIHQAVRDDRRIRRRGGKG